MPSAKPKGKGGAASASPLSLAKKLCTAAHAAIRKEYNTRKPQKYKDHQAKIAEGKRRLEKLVVSVPCLPRLPSPAVAHSQVNVENAHYDDFRDFCEWVENDVSRCDVALLTLSSENFQASPTLFACSTLLLS